MSGQRSAFVLGATGYVGSALVATLRQQSIRVCAHIRPESAKLQQFKPRFEALGARVVACPLNRSDLAAALRDCAPDAVFAIQGTTRARMKDLRAAGGDAGAQSYDAVDFGLTKLLVDALLEAELTPRFVYLSAIGAGPGAMGGYMQARWKAEQAVTASGLPYTIVRPAIISGSDRSESRPGERIGAVAFDAVLKTASLLGAKSLARRYASIDASQLAGAMAKLAFDPARENTVMEIKDLR